MVYVASCVLDAATADALEAVLCEYVRSSWTLTQIRVGEPYTLAGYFDSPEAVAEGRADLRQFHE